MKKKVADDWSVEQSKFNFSLFLKF